MRRKTSPQKRMTGGEPRNHENDTLATDGRAGMQQALWKRNDVGWLGKSFDLRVAHTCTGTVPTGGRNGYRSGSMCDG